jgi:hypothetical protein
MKFFVCLAAGALLAGSAHAATNLIVNGDFESGNTGFTSDHAYVDPTANALVPEGLYTIIPNPMAVHSSWVDLGGSNLMVVNGMTGGSTPVVWQQTLDVVAGTYAFSGQAANVCCNSSYAGPNSPSNLLFQYSFDGVNFTTFDQILTDPQNDAGSFYNVGGDITATGAQPLTLRIANGATAASGNDFAIDNLVLSMTSAVPEPATWAMMIAGMGMVGASLRRRRSALRLA